MRRRFAHEFKVQAVKEVLAQCDDVRLADIVLKLDIIYSTSQRWVAFTK